MDKPKFKIRDIIVDIHIKDGEVFKVIGMEGVVYWLQDLNGETFTQHQEATY
jgi:hypothetical protein